jgi:hypothetical protein
LPEAGEEGSVTVITLEWLPVFPKLRIHSASVYPVGMDRGRAQ